MCVEWLQKELRLRLRNPSSKLPKDYGRDEPTPTPQEDDPDWPPETQSTDCSPEYPAHGEPFLYNFAVYPPLTQGNPASATVAPAPTPVDKDKAPAAELGRGPPPVNLLSKPKINLATKPSGSRAPSLKMPPPPAASTPTTGPPTPSPTTAPVTPVIPQTQLAGAQPEPRYPAPLTPASSWGYIWPNGNYAPAPPHGKIEAEMANMAGKPGIEPQMATPSPSPEAPPTMLPKGKGKVLQVAVGKRKTSGVSTRSASGGAASKKKQPNPSGWSSSPSRRRPLPGEGLMMFEEGLRAANEGSDSPVWEPPIPGGAMDD